MRCQKGKFVSGFNDVAMTSEILEELAAIRVEEQRSHTVMVETSGKVKNMM